MCKHFIKNIEIETVFIIIDDLNENIILGVDFLYNDNAILNFELHTVYFDINNKIIEDNLKYKHNRLDQQIKINKLLHINDNCKNAENTIELNNVQQNAQDNLIRQYATIFELKPGLVKGYEGKIRLNTNKPIVLRPYPIPESKLNAVKDTIKQMLE